MLHRIVGEHITLVAQPERNLPLANADIGMIEQVLLNLVVNARDAMPRGGQLTIVTGQTTLTAPKQSNGFDVQPGTYVWVSVSDTGSGIASEHLPHIFEPFFTTKDVGRGTGLGLATAYGIIRQHHGFIDVESELNRGSTLRFYLPSTTATLPDRPAPPPEDDDLPVGTETLLVVEDELALRNLVVTLLESCGYTVLHASSGVAALEVWAAQRDRIQLLITDIVMPGGVSGRELAQQIRADVPTLPVVYTSGYSPDLTGAGEPLVDGINYLQKPYQPVKLARIVRTRLDHARRS
jgi:CheY-like chemotaxis protein